MKIDLLELRHFQLPPHRKPGVQILTVVGVES